MNSQEIATALRLLDDLYEQKQSFKNWLSGNTVQQDSYDEAIQQLEKALPELCVKRVDIVYRMAHVLAPRD